MSKTTTAKLTLPLKQLQRALAIITPAVERKTTIPVLSTVRIEQTPDALEFAATNLDLAIRVRARRPGSEPVAPFLLSALKLESYAKLLDGDAVTIACDENRATLRCGRSNTKLPLMPVGNFPLLGFGEGSGTVAIPQPVLARLLKHVTFAVSDEESRYVLHGALLVVKDGTLALVSTDGHRLAKYTVPFEHSGEELNILLPANLLTALSKTLNGGEAPAILELSPDSVFVTISDSTGEVALSSKRLAGQFPNYTAVMPKAGPVTVMVAPDAMTAALKRCVTFADARSGAVKFTVTPEEVKMRGASADEGETDDVVETSGSTVFAEFAVGFNGEYLLDAFTRLACTAEIRFADVTGVVPMLVLAEPHPGERFEYVVMPMRI